MPGVEDDVIRFAESGQFGIGRADEHVVHEERVIRTGSDDADFQAVFFVPAGIAVEDVYAFSFIEEAHSAAAVGSVGFRREGDVDFAPPDIVFRGGVFHDAFIFG